MKKHFLIIVLAAIAMNGVAQTIGEAFYVYRNDGQFNAFFREEVDSITYSNYDLDSLYYDEQVTQLIYTRDSLYKILLASIDSISFIQPKEEYKSDVLRMNESWLPYVDGITDYTITFKATTPTEFLPSVGQIIVAETFEQPFDMGFSGRVIKVEETSMGKVFTVEAIGLSDIYEHLVTTGYTSSILENDSGAQSRREVVSVNNTPSTFPLPSVDLSVGPISISCEPDVRLKYIVCIGEPNMKDYVDIQSYHKYQGSASLSVKFDKDYKPEPKWPNFFIPINTGVPGFYGKIQFGLFIRGEGAAELTATVPFEIDGFHEIKLFEASKEERQGNWWRATMEDPELSASLNGSVSFGLAVRLLFGIVHERLASVDLTAYIGPKLSADLNLSSSGMIEKDLYSTIKDSKMTFSLCADLVPGYRWVGESEHKELPGSLSFGYDINSWYTVPEFDNLKWQTEGKGGILNGDISRTLLPKVSLGWGLYDEDDNLYKSDYFSPKYRKLEDWPQNGLEYNMEEIERNRLFKAYPLVKLMGLEMRADKYVELKNSIDISTLDAYEISDNSAHLAGEVSDFGKGLSGQLYFYYSSQPHPQSNGNMSKTIAISSLDTPFYGAAITGLQPNTTYYYITAYNTGREILLGEEKNFTTLKPQISLSDNVACNVTTTQATLSAIAQNYDLSYSYSFSFVYATSISDLEDSPDFIEATCSEDGVLTADISELEPNMTYYFFIRCHTEDGDIDSEVSSFVTKKSGWAEIFDLGSHEAVIRGHIFNFNYERDKSSECAFFYGTDENLQDKKMVRATLSSTDFGTFVEYYFEGRLTDMSDETKYYYAFGVLQDGEYVISRIFSFTTPYDYIQDVLCPDGNHPHLIDLGLPSGTKWSCCDFKTNSPHKIGTGYAWGETVVREKSSYTIEGYPYFDWTNGFVDLGECISGTSYDPVRVTMAGGWAMPTLEQVVELMNNCHEELVDFKVYNMEGGYHWVTDSSGESYLENIQCEYGSGYVLTGPNGNKVFFWKDKKYMTGSVDNESQMSLEQGWYPRQTYGCKEYIFSTSTKGLSTNSEWRYLNIPIRPVAK